MPTATTTFSGLPTIYTRELGVLDRQVVATDNFDRAALGANWSQRNTNWGTLAISGGAYFIGGNGAGDGHESAAAWVGNGNFTPNQYVSVTVSNLVFGGGNDKIGVIARAATGVDSARSYYMYLIHDDASGNPAERSGDLVKVVAGAYTIMNSRRFSWGNGDRIGIACVGTTIYGLRNWGVMVSVNDMDLSSGAVGICGDSSSTRGDSLEAGNIVSIRTGLPLIRRMRTMITHLQAPTGPVTHNTHPRPLGESLGVGRRLNL